MVGLGEYRTPHPFKYRCSWSLKSCPGEGSTSSEAEAVVVVVVVVVVGVVPHGAQRGKSWVYIPCVLACQSENKKFAVKIATRSPRRFTNKAIFT